VQVDEIAEDRVLRCAGGGSTHVDYGTGGVAALANEGLGAGFHAAEVVWNKEELYGGFVWVFDDDLNLAFLGYTIASSGRRSLSWIWKYPWSFTFVYLLGTWKGGCTL